jgi:hypothetical protein
MERAGLSLIAISPDGLSVLYLGALGVLYLA